MKTIEERIKEGNFVIGIGEKMPNAEYMARLVEARASYWKGVSAAQAAEWEAEDLESITRTLMAVDNITQEEAEKQAASYLPRVENSPA